MTHFSAFSPFSGTAGYRRAAAVALGAGSLALIAGCSGGTGSSAASLTPRTAITLAADQAQKVNSMSATMSVQVSGASSESTAGTIQMQLKPGLLVAESLDITAQGQTIPMDAVLSPKAIYLRSSAFSALTGQTGKAWLEIPFSDVSGSAGSALASLFQNVQNGDPMTQARMLAASKNVREVGTQVIDGVRTTHYTGTFTPQAALAKLSPRLRTQLAPLMKLITGDVRFNTWIDAQHMVRRTSEVESVAGETVTTTVTITSINKPVQITVPPKSQALTPPKGALGGTS